MTVITCCLDALLVTGTSNDLCSPECLARRPHLQQQQVVSLAKVQVLRKNILSGIEPWCLSAKVKCALKIEALVAQ